MSFIHFILTDKLNALRDLIHLYSPALDLFIPNFTNSTTFHFVFPQHFQIPQHFILCTQFLFYDRIVLCKIRWPYSGFIGFLFDLTFSRKFSLIDWSVKSSLEFSIIFTIDLFKTGPNQTSIIKHSYKYIKKKIVRKKIVWTPDRDTLLVGFVFRKIY